MTIQQITERELEELGVRCVAVPSLEWAGVKYVWLTSYASGMNASAQKRCQDLCAVGRAALIVRHNNGELTIWQGPTGSAQPIAAEPQGQLTESSPVVGAPTPEPQSPEPQQEESAEPQTITIKYRGRTITKQVGPANGNSQQKGQRSYRGRKY